MEFILSTVSMSFYGLCARTDRLYGDTKNYCTKHQPGEKERKKTNKKTNNHRLSTDSVMVPVLGAWLIQKEEREWNERLCVMIGGTGVEVDMLDKMNVLKAVTSESFTSAPYAATVY